MRILIIAPAWIGDAVMAQPLYRRLHERHPDLQLDIYAPAWTQAVHAAMPEVHQTFDNPFGHGQLRLADRFHQGRQLRQQHYDQVIVLPNSLKSALVPFFARIPRRTGYVGEARSLLLNDARSLDPITLPLMVERFAALAEDKGTAISRPVPYPHLHVDTAQVRVSLQAMQLTAPSQLIALCPGAEYGPAKRWPAAHMAELARHLLARGQQVWLFGSNKDAEIAQAIVAAAPGTLDLCGKTSLTAAIHLLSLAQAVVTNDSGLMHVAAALDRPVIALYGSSSPRFTPPLSDRARIVTLGLECSPCFARQCPQQHLNCLNNLAPAHVLAALDELLIVGK